MFAAEIILTAAAGEGENQVQRQVKYGAVMASCLFHEYSDKRPIRLSSPPIAMGGKPAVIRFFNNL
jgi:hypothetical protein